MSSPRPRTQAELSEAVAGLRADIETEARRLEEMGERIDAMHRTLDVEEGRPCKLPPRTP